MPHYKDGTEAKIGDSVKGKPYNTPHEVVGTIVSISPGSESCNCTVAFITLYDRDKLPCRQALAKMPTSPGEEEVFVGYALDYGGTKDFEKIA